MCDSDDTDNLNRCIEIMNKSHGYGGAFNHRTSADKAIVELATAREWCASVSAEFSLKVGEPEHNSNDPPDCYILVEGQRLGVELVQFVNPNHKRRATNGETPFAGNLFTDMQWTKERLVADLGAVVRKKGAKYQRNGICVDILLIHTAETWLNSNQARRWLTDVQIEPHPQISNVCLLFEYEPGRGVDHWPLLWLYGDLVGVQ